MSFTKDCVSGVRHEGTPEGKVEKINGIDTYVALPNGDYPKDKAILFLTDVFGLALVNNKLLVDDFAKNGYQVYIPDLFDGDPIPEDFLNNTSFDRESWMSRHGPELTRQLLDKAIEGLKEKGIVAYGATGYCFGAKYVVNLMQENIAQVGVVAHPSRIQIPSDLEVLLEKSKAPFLINSCEVDRAFPAESCEVADNLLGEGKYKPGYKRVHWEGCTHGFAVRGDMSDPLVKRGKEGAFAATVEFFSQL